jgi:hypothetical protein
LIRQTTIVKEKDMATLNWEDTEFLVEVEGRRSHVGLVGKQENTSGFDRNVEVILFRFAEPEDVDSEEHWRALRWKLGVVVDLQTNDLDHARMTIDAMYQLEGQ